MLRSTLFILLLSISSISSAICIIEPLEKEFRDSQNVFIATITSATIAKDVDVSKLKTGQRYKIDYTFTVSELFKGKTSHIKLLQSAAVYDDPRDNRKLHVPESTKFVPGDSIIVFAGSEEVVSISFCSTFNRDPNEHAKELRRISHAP